MCIETLPGGEVPARRLSRHNSAGEVESSPQRNPLLRKVPSRRLSRHNSAGKGTSMRSMGGNSMRSLGGSLKNVMEDEVETSYDLGSSFTELGSSFTDVTSKKSHEDIAREKNYVPTRRGNLSRTNSGGRAAGGLSRTNSGKRGRVTPLENCTNSSSFRGILETAEYVEGPGERMQRASSEMSMNRRRSFPPNSERSGSFPRDISLKSLRMYCSASSLSSCGSSRSKQLDSGSGGDGHSGESIRSHNISSMFGSDMDMLGLSWADASSSRSSYQIGESQSQHGTQSQISQITGIHESISSSISSSGLTTQTSSNDINYKPIRSSKSKSKKLFKQMRRLSSGLTGAITRRSSVEKEERSTWNPGYGDVVAATSSTLKRSSTAPLENEQTAAATTTLIDKNINKLRRSDVSVIDGAATIDEESQKNNIELDDDPEYSIAPPPTKPSSRKNILNRLSKSLSSSLRRSSNCTDADVPKQSPRLFRHSTGNADAIEVGYDNDNEA